MSLIVPFCTLLFMFSVTLKLCKEMQFTQLGAFYFCYDLEQCKHLAPDIDLVLVLYIK